MATLRIYSVPCNHCGHQQVDPAENKFMNIHLRRFCRKITGCLENHFKKHMKGILGHMEQEKKNHLPELPIRQYKKNAEIFSNKSSFDW